MRNITIIFLFSTMFLGCKTGSDKTDVKPVVSVSIVPQKYWVDRLSGNKIEVNIMVLPGASHSTYEPTPEQMRMLSRSKLYFRIGHIGFEYSWMEKFRSSNPNMKIVDLSSDLDLHGVESTTCSHGDGNHDHNNAGIDPHIWLNPPMVKHMIQKMANELRNLSPTETDSITYRERLFIKEIDSIDNYITQAVKHLQNRKFLIFHPALSWFAHNYGLQQISIEVDGKEPSLSKMKEIIETIRAENIKVVMIQSEFPYDRALGLSNETGTRIVQIYPLAYDWSQTILNIAHVIEESLQDTIQH